MIFVIALLGMLVVSAIWDVRDRRRHRRRRADRMAAVRHDQRADAWSTQHQGIPSPIGHLAKDPGTPTD